MRVHAENTAAVVDALVRHPAVGRVFYPGLADHPGTRSPAASRASFGAMVSFELEGGEAGGGRLLDGLECFTLAESLGGVESLISHPATMTHAGMDEAARLRAGIGAGLLRVSVGIEDPADLVADLRAGLERAAAHAATHGPAQAAAHGPAQAARRTSLKRGQNRISGGTRRDAGAPAAARSAGRAPPSTARDTAASSSRASASRLSA